ncbi:enoyl-CoA hydratase/isomerase family protein [Streptomyces sp. NPDC006335]|uniref:enoyl-CoA hydratase/isomerase family protein n=1 Tax=Streptomyces sp. NPDC006335 TaxID=3156895 RepID=UPI0033BE9020
MNEMPAPLNAPSGDAIHVEQDGPVLHVQLNPSGHDDTLSIAVVDALTELLDDLQPDIRVLILSSLGEDFCTGADRSEYAAALTMDPTGAYLRRIGDRAHRLCQALESTQAVTIGKLHGGVLGAGLALAAYCDLRAGADTCRFRMPEVGVGLPPAWGGAMGRLISEAGGARIRELMLTCDQFDASVAYRLGLLHKVAPLDQLDQIIEAWTRPLLRRSHEALVLTKRMLASYARADRTADVALLDSHLLTSQLARMG